VRREKEGNWEAWKGRSDL